MSERGKIVYQARAAQLRDYSGLQWGKVSPGDIDCCIELNGQAFAIVELKLSGAGVPQGQRLLIARLVDTLAAGGAAAVGLIAEHDTRDCTMEIPAGSARVVEMRFNHGWHCCQSRRTVREVMERFFRVYVPDELARISCIKKGGECGGAEINNS